MRLSINRGLIDKNEGGDASRFVRGWENVELTAEGLATQINEGVAYCAQLTGGYRKSANFSCAGVASVDMDGGRTIEDVLGDSWIQRHLTILYTTPSHKPERHRFRMIFALERDITTPQEMVALNLSLALKLNGDRAATDATRLFYGSRGSNPKVYSGLIPIPEIERLIEEGRRSNQPDTFLPGAQPATVVSRLTIKFDQEIKVSSGQSVPFKTIAIGERVHCPFHYDEEPSAFVLKSKTGTKGIHCSTCCKTFWPEGTNFPRYDFFDFDKSVKRAHYYYQQHADDVGLLKMVQEEPVHEGLLASNIHLVSSRYLSLDEIQPGITFIKSPKGSGKTEVLSSLIKNADRVLLIGHRIALIGQSCKRLGLESYLNFTPGYLTETRLGICLDSLQRLAYTSKQNNKFVTRYNEFKTIIIDESEQVLTHFLGGTIPDEQRRSIFLLFGRLLRQAERVVALDADLNWLSYEMLSKLASEGAASRYFKPDAESKTSRKPCHIVINEHRVSKTIEVFGTEEEIVGSLVEDIADAKRIFITSNSRNRVEQLAGLIENEFPDKRLILVTSQTNQSPEVVDFIANVRERSRAYDVILASPSMGTGVDITFENDEQVFDVVYGIFRDLITTHFDCDQQLGRVRHPKATKVWISPRRYSFDTAVDVIKKEQQERQAFAGLLIDYDVNFKPIYHTEEALFDLGALIVSQQRASKNDLKRHFIELKKAQGFEVIERAADPDMLQAGEDSLEAARELGQARLIERLMGARTLDHTHFQSIKEKVVAQEHVPQNDWWSFERTRIELFYRGKIDEGLIEIDDAGRQRQKILAFERVATLTSEPVIELSEFRKKMDRRSFSQRFLKNDAEKVPMLLSLLALTPIFDGWSFDVSKVFSAMDLEEFGAESLRLKPIIENVTGLNVRRDVKQKPIMLLSRLLDLIGLCLAEDHIRVENKKKFYYYRLSEVVLRDMQAYASIRAKKRAWATLRELYSFSSDSLDDPDYSYAEEGGTA